MTPHQHLETSYRKLLELDTFGNNLEELDSDCHVVNDGGVVGGCLVVHAPASAYEFQP